MISDRARLLALLAVLAGGLLSGCQQGQVRVCENEHESMLSDGTIRIEQLRALSDPTAGGVLQGESPEGGDRPNKVVLLLDYSGSMFGGYGKAEVPNCGTCRAGLGAAGSPERRGQPYYFEIPAFVNLLARWLDAATPPGSRQSLEVLLFNARVWRLGESGLEAFEGGSQLTFPRPVGTASTDQIADWLRQIPDSPFAVDQKAPNTTESRMALEAAVEAIEDEAIVWLITDNIVDQGGGVVSAEDARRNLDFYSALRSDPRVQMIAAYPLHHSEACSWMCGTSLFAYGIYVAHFQRPSSREFHRLGGTTADGGGPMPDGLLWNPAIKELAAEYGGRAAELADIEIAGVPLRLKPIDTEVLSFDFTLHRNQALRCDESAEYGDKLRCVIRAKIRNTLRHQTVESVRLTFWNHALLPRKAGERRRLPWASAVCSGEMRAIAWRVNEGPSQGGDSPILLGPLAPLEAVLVDVVFDLPAIYVDTASRRHLLDVALTDRILLDGRISAELQDIRTALFIQTEGLESVYGAPELPGIFRGQEEARVVAVYPAGATISNNGQLLGFLILLAGGSLSLLLVLGVMRFQRFHLTVLVDGVELAKFGLPRLSRRSLEIEGSNRAVLSRRWSANYRLRPRAGHRLRKDGQTWVLITPDEGHEYRVEVRRGWGSSARRRARTAVDNGW